MVNGGNIKDEAKENETNKNMMKTITDHDNKSLPRKLLHYVTQL